jgi:acetolactate synthase-1/3 small subunit
MENKQKFTVSVYTESNIGLINRVSAIFLKRHINIESLTVSPSEIDQINRFTVVVIVSETLIKKVVGQLEKQVEVIKVFYHTEEEIIYQETAMVKLSTEYLYDEKIQKRLKLRRAHMVIITKDFFVIETTGLKEDIDKFYCKLKPYGLLQFVRSGRIAITRPRMGISDYLNEKFN